MSELAALRGDVRSFLDDRGIGEAVRDELLLVLTELASNAIAADGPDGEIRMRVSLEGTIVHLEVDDGGRGFELPADDALPAPERERGRGLFLVRALTDDVAVMRRDHRTVVRASRHVGILVPRGAATPFPTGSPARFSGADGLTGA